MKGQTDEQLRRTLFSESEVGRILLPRGFIRWYTSHAREVSNALATIDYSGFPKYGVITLRQINTKACVPKKKVKLKKVGYSLGNISQSETEIINTFVDTITTDDITIRG